MQERADTRSMLLKLLELSSGPRLVDLDQASSDSRLA
jgi:hypothetical protein